MTRWADRSAEKTAYLKHARKCRVEAHMAHHEKRYRLANEWRRDAEAFERTARRLDWIPERPDEAEAAA